DLGVTAVACGPGGSDVTTAGYDRATEQHHVTVWDARTRKRKATFPAQKVGFSNLDYSPDGRRLANADWDGAVTVWEVATRAVAHKWRWHRDDFTRVVFSADGRRLAACGVDGRVIVWDFAAGRTAVDVRADGQAVDVAFSRDGERVTCV